jgi:TonB family protein
MFDQLVVSAATGKRTGRWFYFTTAAAVWMMAFMAVIVAGIFAYDARLSSSMRDMVLVAPLPSPARVGGASGRSPNKDQPVQAYVSAKTPPAGLPAPSPNPPDIARVSSVGDEGPGCIGDRGVHDGVIDGVRDGIPHGLSSAAPPPPPPVETKKVEPDPTVKTPPIVRKVSTVLQGSAIRRVQPTYPVFAKNAGISGQVVVEVTVDEEGNVTQARALSGHPLLKKVSLDAAYGWKWRPTLLNNIAVKVIGTITFNFQL